MTTSRHCAAAGVRGCAMRVLRVRRAVLPTSTTTVSVSPLDTNEFVTSARLFPALHLLVLVTALVAALCFPVRASAAGLPARPASTRATWWGADMGTIDLNQHVFTTGQYMKLTVTVANGGCGGPRWKWTDSGWIASGIYEVTLSGLSTYYATMTSISPNAATSAMSFSSSNGYGAWGAIETESCPIAYTPGWSQSDVAGTNRFPTGKTFTMTQKLTRTTNNQWAAVSTHLHGNIGYLHWGPSATEYVAVIGGDTHLTLTASPTKVSRLDGTTSRLTATYKDDNDDPIPGEIIHLALSDNTKGSLSAANPETDSQGTATATFTPTNKGGKVTVTAIQNGKSASVVLETEAAYEVEGDVSDGHGHDLEEIRVGLFHGSETTALDTTITSSSGYYRFDPFQMTEDHQYWVKVFFQNKKADPADFRLVHRTDTDSAVYAARMMKTDDADGDNLITRDFNLGAPGADMQARPSGVVVGNLDEVGAVYYHTKQAFDFWNDTVGVALNHDLPEDVVVYDNGGTRHDNHFSPEHNIYIRAADMVYNGNRPMNREWHEFAHHVNGDGWEHSTVPGFAAWWPFHNHGGAADVNHDGWWNECTSDSLAEGFAEFSSAFMKGEGVDSDAPPLSKWLYTAGWGVVNLELNENQALDRLDGSSTREEYIVARIMWDFYDSAATYPSGYDEDGASLTVPQLMGLLGEFRDNVHGVYSAAIDLPDGEITDAKVNEIFLSHGAFADLDWDGTRDATEPIGWLADGTRTARTSAPAPRGTAIGLDVHTPGGGTVRNMTAILSVDYGPATAEDFSYEWPIDAGGTPTLYLPMPSASIPTTITVRLGNTDDVTGTTEATITSADFWAANAVWRHRPDSVSNDRIMTASFTLAKAGSSLRFTSVESGASVGVTYSNYVTVFGKLEPLQSGATVKLYHRPNRSTRWSYLGSGRTSSTGLWSTRVRPLKSGALEARYAGDGDHNAATKRVSVRVRHKVSWSSAATRVRRGARFTFSGSVSPSHPRRRVALQRRLSSGAWSTLAYATLSSRSRYSGVWRPRSAGAYHLRVILAGCTVHATGESGHRNLTVY